MSSDKLEWCSDCYAWKPHPHDRVRAPWRVRARRRLSRPFWRLSGRFERLAERIAGNEEDPPPPPDGFRQKRGSWSTFAYRDKGR